MYKKTVNEAKSKLSAAQTDLRTGLTSLLSTLDRDEFAHAVAKEAYSLQYWKVENRIASPATIINNKLNLA